MQVNLATVSAEDKKVIDKTIVDFYQGINHIKGRVHVAQENLRRKDFGIPPGCHVHDYWEMKIALKGQFPFEMPGYLEFIPEGHIMLTPPNTVHVEYQFGSKHLDEGSSFFYMGHRQHNQCEVGIQYHDRFIFYTLTEGESIEFNNLTGSSPAILFERLVPPEPYPPHLEFYHMSLLRMVLSLMHAILAQEAIHKLTNDDLICNKIFGFIESRFCYYNVSVDVIVNESGFSAAYLDRMFKSRYGKSIRQMIVDLRLEKAARLLGQKKYSIKEVSHLCGWSSPFYFSRVFSKKHGIPPALFSHFPQIARGGAKKGGKKSVRNHRDLAN